MLTELRIENFAIIDKLDLEFDAGLIIFTGETGAGKSIIMDAVQLLLGGRPDPTFIRADSERTVVEGLFKLNGAPKEAVTAILTREELLDDPNYVTLTRELRREGRNVARLNGRTVNATLLREVGAALVDIHGQTEHFSLLDVRAHLNLLDRYASVDQSLSAYRQTYAALQAVRRELNDIRRLQRDADRRVEMLTFQAEEIEAARLKAGEDLELKQERDRLANAESLATLAQEALAALDEGTPEAPAASDLLGQAAHAVASLARIDASQNELAIRAEELFENLSDLAQELRHYLDRIEYNPKRLEQAEERLDLIHRLCRKYGGSIDAANQVAVNARRELETITNATEKIAELASQEAGLLKKLAEQGLTLSKKRQEAAERLGKQIEIELDDLKMASARFGTDFQMKLDPNGVPLNDGRTIAFDATGFDRVEFLVAPNPGEGLKPLAKIASGGETSRLMLALKNVLARADQVPTLIFDEIDQGIGGRVGGVVGSKLWNLGRSHQVMCITHLPQLAAFGDQHYQVQKILKKGRTTTDVKRIEGEDRMLELALMLGEVSEGTLQSASEIMQSARALMHGVKK